MTKVVSYTAVIISLFILAWGGRAWFTDSPEQLPAETAKVSQQLPVSSQDAIASSTPDQIDSTITSSSQNTTANTDLASPKPDKTVENSIEIKKITTESNAGAQAETGYADAPYVAPNQRKAGNLGGPPTPEMVFSSPDGSL